MRVLIFNNQETAAVAVVPDYDSEEEVWLLPLYLRPSIHFQTTTDDIEEEVDEDTKELRVNSK